MTIFEKTLYLQRLIFAIEQSDKRGFADKYAAANMGVQKREAEDYIDAAIECYVCALEVVGYFPTIREKSK